MTPTNCTIVRNSPWSGKASGAVLGNLNTNHPDAKPVRIRQGRRARPRRQVMLTVGVMLSNAQIQRDPMFTVRRHRFSCALLLLVVLMVSLQRFWKADLTAGATKG
jgi:hypothetical protein